MLNNSVRLAILALILTNATNALSDQKIKTKSNIKNDRMEQPASPEVKCPDTATDSAATANSTDKPITNNDCAAKSSSENTSSAASEAKKTTK